MSRLAAALAALLLLAGAARAQDAKKREEKQEAPAKKEAPELDPATKAAIQREVEKAREQIRDEVRAEIQGAQSAAEFLGAVAEGPKLQFLQLDGYFRVRGQLFHNFDLGAPADPGGYFLFPHQLLADKSGTQATSNMRLRLEPTLNVSELVRVRAQIDVLDNYVLGSSTSQLFDNPFSPYPVPFYGSSRLLRPNDPTADRAPILPKRVWGEVQTPVGLLSFGRMPSEWGLGILTNAGGGIDDDFGDTVDRIQFALPPVQTPLGALTFVPILDFDHEGVLSPDPHFGTGVGQPFDLDSTDDARTYAIKIARIDTDDEVRRKLDRNEKSFNFGGYYNYRTQRSVFPTWEAQGYAAEPIDPASVVKRGSYGHVFSLWTRLLTPRWRVEAEGVGVVGHIGVASTVIPGIPPLPATVGPTPYPVLLRQWGGVLLGEYKAIPNKLMLGAELGVASGDPAPGFGNVPGRLATTGAGQVALPAPGAYEGPQYGLGDDHTIGNFRFNPSYRIDLILWRGILGQVTDAAYLKPKLRWDIFPGLAFDGSIVYSQAMYAASTPSQTKRPLGIELDTALTYTTGSGFQAFGQWGILQPLSGMGTGLARGQMLAFGLAVKF